MANIVIMPKQGLQMTEGLITKWLKSVGDTVTEGEPLFEMETDKLTITIDSSFTGTLLAILHAEGEEVPITEPIAVIGEADEDIGNISVGKIAEVKNISEGPKVQEIPLAPVEKAPNEPAPVLPTPQQDNSRVFITPRAKMRCAERGITDYSRIPGTGDNNLIIERDVLAYRIPNTSAECCSRILLAVDALKIEEYKKKTESAGTDPDLNGLIQKAVVIAAKKFDVLDNVTVKSLAGTDVAVYMPSISKEDTAILSTGGIYSDGNSRKITIAFTFSEEELPVDTVAESLSYLKTLLENPILVLAL